MNNNEQQYPYKATGTATLKKQKTKQSTTKHHDMRLHNTKLNKHDMTYIGKRSKRIHKIRRQ